ncbi:DUF5987 family protein [Streptomyces sp. Lzd4kr]|nr:DUF5987 family protein [Streptomyces sp. Lzd4kr]
MTLPDRRVALRAMCGAILAVSVATRASAATSPRGASASRLSSWTTQTLEAFADTLIPGESRWSSDHAVPGVVRGPGAVHAGAMDVLADESLPLRPLLPGIAALLNARATGYALERLIPLPVTRPPFVGLSFAHRTYLLQILTGDGDADLGVWQVLSLVTCLAFDTAGQDDTTHAARTGHPGLSWIGFPQPDSSGRWTFPEHSYRSVLAPQHPRTTTSGSPA